MQQKCIFVLDQDQEMLVLLFSFFFLHLFSASQAFNSRTSDGHVKQLRVPIGKAVVRGNGTIYSASLVVEVM